MPRGYSLLESADNVRSFQSLLSLEITDTDSDFSKMRSLIKGLKNVPHLKLHFMKEKARGIECEYGSLKSFGNLKFLIKKDNNIEKGTLGLEYERTDGRESVKATEYI